MQNIRTLVICAMAILALPAARAVTITPRLHNEHVYVTEDTLDPGQSLPLSDHHASVVIYLSGNEVSVGAKKRAIQRGETVFLAADRPAIANTGATPLRFVRVEFLDSGSTETWGGTGLPPNYKVLFENRFARVYDIRIPAQSREERHTHHDRVVVCLSGAKLEHILTDRRTQPSTLTTGDVVWRPGQTHVGHNIGNTNLWAIAIEPK